MQISPFYDTKKLQLFGLKFCIMVMICSVYFVIFKQKFLQ